MISLFCQLIKHLLILRPSQGKQAVCITIPYTFTTRTDAHWARETQEGIPGERHSAASGTHEPPEHTWTGTVQVLPTHLLPY